MRLTLTEEQQELSTMLRHLFADACRPALVRRMKEPDSDGIPAELWGTLAKAGVFGIAVDGRYGGEDAGLFELGLVFAEAGRALCPTAVYDTLLFAVAVQRLASEEQRAELLPRVVGGELRGTAAISNPSDAGDLRPRLTAERTGGGWSLSGTLMFVGNGSTGGTILVTARTAAFPEPSRVIGVLLDPARPGVEATPLHTFAGDKQTRLELRDYLATDAEVLAGPDGDGLRGDDLAWASNAFVALQCMEMVGGATAVLERTVDYVKVREQFNRPIASFQAAQHHVANMRIAIEGARLAAAQAVWWLGRGDLARRAVAIAKMHASEAYKWTTLNAHQLHGGMGYVRETDLHLWSERAKVTEIKGGTADIAAGWLQRELGLAR
ncbi:acyl-CoA dehydrogenase family protein [Dactylosporangium sp. NPDC000555]|uniref:acyl-CoA dehydrogenase family protein n=1 Tax=Dactylosporangium sp. NPDC000555 TaxID=3154260 RepID=UPI00332B8DE3